MDAKMENHLFRQKSIEQVRADCEGQLLRAYGNVRQILHGNLRDSGKLRVLQKRVL